jgi:MFS family permease
MVEITLQLRSEGGALEGNGYATGYAWFNVAFSIGTIFGPLLAGWIVQQWSWKVLCYFMGLLAGVTVIPVVLYAEGPLCIRRSDDTENS